MAASKLKPLRDQVVVITGASSGIGLVTARAAAKRGARVLLVARNETALAEAVRSIEADGGIAAFALADVGVAEEVRNAAAKAVELWGRIDTFVNNAGVAIYAKLVDTPLAEHERMMRTNYFGAVNGSMTALEHLRDNGGALITVGSIASDLPSPVLSAYSATKHAVKAYVKALRMEIEAAKLPVSVTLVKPAGIDTPIAQHAANHVEGEARIPPPVYDPVLVADAILDAAEHPIREITVGGTGRAQVLFGLHFPRLLERLSPFMMPQLADRSLSKTESDALFGPAEAGRERSGVEHGRRFSLHAVARRHPLLVTAGVALGGLWLGDRLRRRNHRF